MSANTERVVLGVLLAGLIVLALTYGYLLIRREPGSRYTRVGVFFERDRIEHEELELEGDENDTKVIEQHWPKQEER